jgi:DNA-binding beta-propeller fold protein YncE
MGSHRSEPVGGRSLRLCPSPRALALAVATLLLTLVFVVTPASPPPATSVERLGGSPQLGQPDHAAPIGGVRPHSGTGPFANPAGTQIDESGSLAAVVPTGPYPYYPGYDPANGEVYVPDAASDTVAVIRGTTWVANVTVPGGITGAPYTAAYDAADQEMYVTIDDAGYVTVINGTDPVANISVPGNPIPLAYDPADGDMYVGQGADNQATILNGTTVVGTVKLAGSPSGAAYDAADQSVYFAAGALGVVNGTRLVANVTAGSSDFESGVAYDPATQEIYASNDVMNNVSCVRGTSAVGSFNLTDPGAIAYDSETSALYVGSLSLVGGQYVNSLAVVVGTNVTARVSVNDGNVSPGIHGLAYDPTSATVYAASGPRNLSVISTVLGLDPLNVTPAGDPTGSADVGQERNFSAELWAVGNNTLTPSIVISPAFDWTCGNLSWNATALGPDALNESCRPDAPGTYSVWANVTDGDDEVVSSEVTLSVFADPAATLEPRVDGVPVTDVDASATVDVWVNVAGGSGNFSYVLGWSPVYYGECSSLLSSNDFQCVFPYPGVMDLQGYATDSDGVRNATPVLGLIVVAGLTVGTPSAAPGSVDVGQSVRLSVTTTNGTGLPESFAWSGLAPGNCTSLGSSSPACVFPAAGTYPIQVVARDAGGGVAASPTFDLSVDPALSVGAVSAGRASFDVGQSMSFVVPVIGGLPPYTVAWQGLPLGCAAAPTGPTVACTVTTPGSVSVSASVTDANGERVNASAPWNVTIDAPLEVDAPTTIPLHPVAGATLTIVAIRFGGAPGFTYEWTGLPAGCASTTATVVCEPSAGSYVVGVTVSDANSARVPSEPLDLVIGPSTGASGSGTLSRGTTELLAVGVVAAAAVLVGVAVLLTRRRRTN